MSGERGPLRVVGLSAGASEPSATRLLIDAVAKAIGDRAAQDGRGVDVEVVELRHLLPELPGALGSRLLGPGFERTVDLLRAADVVIAGAPVYKAGASALLTAVLQVMDDDILIAKPTVLAATAGTARHALVIDDQLRSLFAFMRAVPVPTSVFAAPSDWGDAELTRRVERAAAEAFAFASAGIEGAIRGSSWSDYQHRYGSDGGAEVTVDLESDLMRLATGGGASAGAAASSSGLTRADR